MSGFTIKPFQKSDLASFSDCDSSNTQVGLDDKRRNPAFPLRLTARELAELKNIAATTPNSMHEFCIRAIRDAIQLQKK
jgi:hypothetical protein